MKFKHLLFTILAFAMVAIGNQGYSQGVTTAAVNGYVLDERGEGLPGANVIALHEPSGTRYATSTLIDGRYSILGMRVGGPYTLTVSYIGYETQKKENIFLSLGVAANVSFTLRESGTDLSEIVVSGQRSDVFSSDRTGAATNITNDQINKFPTISRRIGDFTRLTPQASGSSFAGQDNRLNNITVDGSYFNNSFGLGGQPGDRTGVSPISLDAIEQIQVNIAPYDVRQGNFVGAGINTVTRSGTNDYSGSVYYLFRNQNQVGNKAKELEFDPGQFDYNMIGMRLGGPIIKNKLFFFANFESETETLPGTTFRANKGGEPVAGNVTRVLASDLNSLSNFLRQNFNYETGPYEGYDNTTAATKFLIKLDYNLNDRNKFSLRYNHLDSDTDVLLSQSSSLGWGTRRSNLFGMNFQNSNYKIMENLRSIVGEWNSRIGNNMANNLIVGFNSSDESRNSLGTMFPFVDILDGSQVYTSFGFEPFTPNNELRYNSFQLQNNFTIFKDKHTYTFGLSLERYESENIFFPGSQSVYVYNSLQDFYNDANGYLANPNRTVSNVNLRRFQLRYSNIPGQDKPVQALKVLYAGVYGQDEIQVNKNLNLTVGLRLDVPFFGETALRNSEVEGLNFRDENGNTVKYSTDKLPNPNILWSPRVGFNWDVNGDRSVQVRGGTGIFTARPAYVWISNQIGNNGVMTGFERLDNTTARPFNPNPQHYAPGNVTGAPAAAYELALTDPDFKFPQIWRTNLAVDARLPWGMIGTAEFLYSRDVNGIYYINANLQNPNGAFTGPDARPRWVGGNAATRINSKIDNAVVLKNQNVGYAYNISGSLEKPFSSGFYAKLGYNYGIAKNTVDPGSIAFGSWNGNQHAGNPNDPGLGFSGNTAGHRIFAALSYSKEYFNFGATSISLFWEGRTIGNGSYVFGGDMNGDGGTANDLIYIARNLSEMNFQTYTATISGQPVTFTAQQQADAWERYILQDKYLSKMRGKYAERGAVFLPFVYRADLAITQDIFTNIGGKRNSLQFRADILNVGNLLNSDWGVGQRFINNQPLIPAGVTATGAAQYRLRNIGNQLMSETFQQTLGASDVYRIQFGFRYTFN